MRKRQKQEKRRLKKIAKFHAIFSTSLFIFYVGLSLIYSPGFLFSDVRSKFQALADSTLMITGKVLAPPVIPVVSGVANCNNGALSISLSWPVDENSDSFSISRAGQPLVNGLITNQYKDDVVTTGMTYVYIVTAHGPMGTGVAVSAPISITTPPNCENILPPPIITVNTISGKDVSSLSDSEINEQKPTFSGTVNIANAKIHLEIHSETVVIADIQANENGYWSWTSPVKLPSGNHTLSIAAVDPLDANRFVAITQDFIIAEESDGNNKSSSSSKDASPHKNSTNNVVIHQTLVDQRSIPVDFYLEIARNELFQGKNLTTKINLSHLDAQYENVQGIIQYTILDEKGQIREIFSDNVVLYTGEVITRNILIPAYYKDGRYSIQVEVILDKYNVSQIKSFSVLPLPVLNFGGGVVATYPELLSQTGTVALWLLFALTVWLFLFSREYWLYLHAFKHITENNLARTGLFGERKRKGVEH